MMTQSRTIRSAILGLPGIGYALRKIKKRINRPIDVDEFLRRSRGVIHIGANTGQERDLYARHGLPVVWIEPIPEVFQALEDNISNYSEQRAFQCLVTDKDGADYEFHIANNTGQSSSILDLKMHKDIWPTIHYGETILLRSVTLTTLVEENAIDLSRYDALILDTQGSELLALKGADPVLHKFKFIKTEVADFEAYAGCCQLSELSQFLRKRGFREIARQVQVVHQTGGKYFDIVYKRYR